MYCGAYFPVQFTYVNSTHHKVRLATPYLHLNQPWLFVQPDLDIVLVDKAGFTLLVFLYSSYLSLPEEGNCFGLGHAK